MPFGEGQTIFKPVRTRHFHSVSSAHAEYGLPHDRIRALMKANDPGFRDGLSDASTYFDAATLRPILEAARDTLNSREAGDVLGVSEEMVHGLLSVGVLTQVEKRADGERAFVRIEMRALEALVQSLESKSTVVAFTEGLVSLASAAPAFRQPFNRLVEMVLDGGGRGVHRFRRRINLRTGPYCFTDPTVCRGPKRAEKRYPLGRRRRRTDATQGG